MLSKIAITISVAIVLVAALFAATLFGTDEFQGR
jgi:hypothetical protein